jgi:LPS export ABC transporter protein LptC
MFGVAKHLSKLCWPALLTGMLIISACENDLKKIREISAVDVSKPIERYNDVDIIYSDSAKVKFRIRAPLLLQSTGKDPYNEMPKGVNVTLFDAGLRQIGTLTADYAIQRENEKTIKCENNVVARNEKGETFKSDELIWDQNTKQMHSNKMVHITMANGDVMNGNRFQSDQTLNHWTIDQSTGIFNVTDSPAQ